MCWYCGSPVTDDEPVGRSLRCPDCGKDMRSCRNCVHYMAGARLDCAEGQAQGEADKERGNFCDWFRLNPRFRSRSDGDRKAASEAASGRKAFDALFT